VTGPFFSFNEDLLPVEQAVVSWDVIVVGGGPAGLFAAGRAAELGAKVLVVERNPDLGRKLLISGGGRCNLTNAETDVRVLAEHYQQARNALLSPFTKFPPERVLEWFETHGLPTKVEALQRAFPADDRAQSVLEALQRYAHSNGVSWDKNNRVLGLECVAGGDQKKIAALKTARGRRTAERFILATGGNSRPETGSTGDGFAWLKELGLRVRVPEPSLVPIAVKEPWVADLAGIAFADVGLSAKQGDTVLEKRRGKLLFTHFGLSGPLVLNFASALALWRSRTARKGDLSLAIDLFPDEDNPTFDRKLTDQFRHGGAKKLKNSLGQFGAPRLITQILRQARVDGEVIAAQLTKDDRNRLAAAFKGLTLTFRKLMDESRAVVTSGGLHIDEVDWRTMTIKGFANLGVVGDLLDINRPSGGFSLQLCWSTAWVAGSYAGRQSDAVVPTSGSELISKRP